MKRHGKGTPSVFMYSESVTLANNTAKQTSVTVPAGVIWELQSIKVTNPDDVNRAVTVVLYNEAVLTNVIAVVGSETVAASGGRLQFPHNTPGNSFEYNHNIKGLQLAPGMTIWFNWAAGGASAGGTDADGLVILYKRL